eukprot:2014952-Rhodomonas_salina.3
MAEILYQGPTTRMTRPGSNPSLGAYSYSDEKSLYGLVAASVAWDSLSPSHRINQTDHKPWLPVTLAGPGAFKLFLPAPPSREL